MSWSHHENPFTAARLLIRIQNYKSQADGPFQAFRFSALHRFYGSRSDAILTVNERKIMQIAARV